ncbi:MAG: F-actin-capping protein subunit beta, partial [Watsoniomyces obsoletus]
MSAVPLFSTRIMGVTPQCDLVACEAEKAAFGVGNEEIKDPPNAAFAHKFVLDLDGNSFSGRYYRLLQSKSVVLKQTLFEEWHDDRIIPWLHFVPVSTSFAELPELMRFMATTERGEEIAARIAEESRNWASKALRDVDMQL